MRTAVLLAVAFVHAGGQVTEKEVGEKWLFGDLLKHFNDSKKFKDDKVKFAKVPSETEPGTMYFYGDDGKTPGEGIASANDRLAPKFWSGFGVSDLKTREAAQRHATFLQDQRNEAEAFSWGRYVFRGRGEVLKIIRPLLPH